VAVPQHLRRRKPAGSTQKLVAEGAGSDQKGLKNSVPADTVRKLLQLPVTHFSTASDGIRQDPLYGQKSNFFRSLSNRFHKKPPVNGILTFFNRKICQRVVMDFSSFCRKFCFVDKKAFFFRRIVIDGQYRL
jgi:hypothetical protein